VFGFQRWQYGRKCPNISDFLSVFGPHLKVLNYAREPHLTSRDKAVRQDRLARCRVRLFANPEFSDDRVVAQCDAPDPSVSSKNRTTSALNVW
jgi:hypothetical protein